MTEKQKMLSGQLYDSMDPQLLEDRLNARLAFQKINTISEDQKKERDQLFQDLMGDAGEGLWIEPPFYCDYGYNIKLGKNVFMNFNCCILDVMEVTLGNNVMLAPNVQIYTATHPLEAKERNSGREFAKPITIGNDVWIGGGAIICPGVIIGNGVVVGAGSVVTKNVPDNVFVAGNPAKIVKKIDN
jgi:maltose O-acetyltransferase